MAVQTKIISIQVVLRLKSLGKRTLGFHFQQRLEQEIWHCESEEAEDRKLSVLLGNHSFPEVVLHVGHP